jgi:hypothetical protein
MNQTRDPALETEAQMMNRFAERLFGPRPPSEVIDAKEAARRRLDAAYRAVREHRSAEANGFVVPPDVREKARAEVRAAETHAIALGIDVTPPGAVVDLVGLRALAADTRNCIPGTSAIPIDRLVLHCLLNQVEGANAEVARLTAEVDTPTSKRPRKRG